MKMSYDDAYALDRKLELDYGLIEAGIMTPNDYRRSIGLEPLRSESMYRRPYYSEKDIPKVLNCPNCGAPITGCKCEYCGTVFKQEEPAQRFYADGVEYASLSISKDIGSETTRVYNENGKQIAKIKDYE